MKKNNDISGRELYIKTLIKEKGKTIKDFAFDIDMPYTTLLSMLNGSIGGASVDNVLKICQGLGISVETLQQKSPQTYKGRELSETDIIMLTLFHQIPENKQSKFLDIFESLLKTAGLLEEK